MTSSEPLRTTAKAKTQPARIRGTNSPESLCLTCSGTRNRTKPIRKETLQTVMDATLDILVKAIAEKVLFSVNAELCRFNELPRVQPALFTVKEAAI